MTAAIDITTEQRKTLSALLHRFIPGVAVWAYGSRVKWTARLNSDLDLVAFTTPAQRNLVSELKDALDESDLPFLVDFHVWDEVPERFHEIIRKEFFVLQEARHTEVGSGMVGSGFRECTLDDIAEFRNGKTLSTDMYLPFGQHPIFGSNGQIARTNEVLTKEPLVVIGRVGAYCGSVHYVGEPAWVTDNAIIATGKDQTDVRFLFYLLGSLELRRTAIGSAQPLMTQGGLKVVPTIVPPLLEQKAIAHILGTLDDKIELNRRMNETLEAMTRAIFKSWFVDFDPVRAKAEGRDPGLPRALAELFPDSFEDSELGEIPKGWAVGTLAGFASLNCESWSKDTRPDIINYVDLSNTKWGHIEAVTTYAQQDAPSRAQRVLRPGDAIVGTVRPGNGSYAFISEDRLTGSTGFAALRPHRPEYAQFIYLAATAAENIETLAHLADGGAYPAVRPEVVIATPVIQPDDKVISRFSRASDPMLAKMAQNERESRTLAALRDTLLPKLISGELRVQAAERAIQDATI